MENVAGLPPIAVVVVTQTSCCLSIIGSVIIILTYVMWKDIRTSSRLLLVYLSIADFFTAAGYSVGSILAVSPNANGVMVNNDDPPAWCIAESIIANCAQMMSFFWTISIAVFLYMTIVRGNLKHVPRFMDCSFLVSFGVPTVIILIAACSNVLGSDESKTSVGWCWIRVGGDMKKTDSILWMLLVGKGWELLSYFILPAIYIAIKFHIMKRTRDPDVTVNMRQDTLEAMIKVNRKLTFIPLVYLALRIWGSIRFLLFVIGTVPSDGVDLFLQVMHGIGDSFQGGANCIIFCAFTTSVRQKIVSAFQAHCSKCHRGKGVQMHGNAEGEKAHLLPDPGSVNIKTSSLSLPTGTFNYRTQYRRT